MPVAVDWPTKEITIDEADLPFIDTFRGRDRRRFDLDQYHFDLRALEASEEGIIYPRTHDYTGPINFGGASDQAPIVTLINDYFHTFEDNPYAAVFEGANTNVQEFCTINQVSVRSNNSFGLSVVSVGSGLSPEQDQRLTEVHQDRGLATGVPKTIVENTKGSSYDETVGGVTKEVRKSGATTTITRT